MIAGRAVQLISFCEKKKVLFWVLFSTGVMEDEEFTPEQKKGLRELLLECLEHFDEREILDFLIHSIEFRVKFCPPPHYLLPPGPYPSTFPSPEPGPGITPRSPTKPLGITPRSPKKTPMPTSEANPKTRATTTSSGQTSASPLTTEAATQSAMVKERRLIENAVFEDDMADLAEDVTFEDAALSKIQSDEPVLNQKVIKDDANAEVVKEASNKRASSPGNSRFVGIGEKDSAKKLSQRMKKLLSPQQFKLSKADLAPEKEIAESPEDEALSDIGKPEVPISDHSVGRAEELVEPAKRLAKKSSSLESKLTLSNLVSDKKSLLNELVDPGESESKQPNDRSIVGSSEKVGKTSLSTNSDEGEFSSVMTIDYSETTHEADPGVVGVNLGLIAESK